MKQITYTLLLCLLLVSCSPTSNIITSKSEAQKRGIYQAPQSRSALAKNTTTATTNREKVAARKVASVKPKKSSNARINDKQDDDIDVSSENASYVVKQLINSAESNLGAGYHTGGTSADTGFDCSGLVFSTFQKFDISLPRSSYDMAKVGHKINESEIREGDLIFFKTNGRHGINHVGMVTEVSGDEIKFIHSSTQKGVIISSTKEPYYERTYAQANRVIVNM